jgi:hypothetical protein
VTRFAAPENEAAVVGFHVPYVLLADLDFQSGHVYVTSGDRAYTFGDNVYQPLGTLCAVGEVTESGVLNPEKLELTLSGVDTSLMSVTLTEKYHGRSAILYVAYADKDWKLVADPEMLWEGRMDVMTIQSEANGSAISLVCENRLIMWNKSSDWLYTHEHQGLLTALTTDNFFDKITEIQDKIVKWGGTSVTTGGSGARGGGGSRGPTDKK